MNARIMLGVSMLLFSLALPAEDIDLFVGLSPTPTTEKPNVLIVVDNTANWSQNFRLPGSNANTNAYTQEKTALAAVLNGLPANEFRVGFMLFSETGGGNSNTDGGYVRAAIRDMSSSNKPIYANLITSLGENADKSNGGKAGLAMMEAYRYFAGGAPHAGNNKIKTDYTGNTSGTAQDKAVYALVDSSGQPDNALSSIADTSYLSPVDPNSCAGNYIIYLSNGPAQDNASDTSTATTALSGVGGDTTTISISPNGSQTNVADEWARFMKLDSGLDITTYTIEVNRGTTGQGPGWTALMKSVAGVSSGKYFDVSSNPSSANIAATLNAIFSEIQAVNSVFASVSLPVSVNMQGTYLNQVYVGMFRPDPGALPRWAGNLKQYKLGMVSDDLKLQDAASQGAINSSTGFITECARSFWTPTTVDTYWTFKPQGGCLSVANSEASNYPDGNIVEKGAQGYKLRAATSRTVYTCAPAFASCTALTNFTTANAAITQALLGAADATARTSYINWTRSDDIQDEDIDANVTEVRPSLHGDIVHSRPVAINYGTDASPQVVVFYGGNDGMLHAINGNRTGNVGSFTEGAELWSFVPPEFYGNVKRLYTNAPLINFYGTSYAGALPKPYSIDGPITAYLGDVYRDAGPVADQTFIYATMRRGGRALYAFDVTAPASPTLKWKRGCPNPTNDTGCSTGFSGIGQTWSSPHLFRSEGYVYTTEAATALYKPMLMMGGGYDVCEDSDPHTCTSDTTKGNKIYVLDADTGALLQTFNTERAVIGDVFLVPGSGGKAIYAYAADLGGNIYRIKIGDSAPDASGDTNDWSITKIADLGCGTPTDCTDNRKFMFNPDVVQDTDGSYIILIGSGDREKPLLYPAPAAGSNNVNTIQNHFFMLRDKPTDADWLDDEATACGSEVICLSSLLEIEADDTPTATDLAAKKGWYLELGSREQVVTSAITVFGVVTFSTHEPFDGTALYDPTTGARICKPNLGTARVYNIGYTDAASANGTADRFEEVSGGGLPPSPIAGMVTLDDGTTVPFVIGASPDSAIEASSPSGGAAESRPTSRVYWYINKQ